MFENIFTFLSGVESFFWGYAAFILIFAFGLYLTIKQRFFQVRQIPSVLKTFFQFFKGDESSANARGVHPLKAFFASVGGMIGIGNVVGIVTAVQIGGPGALFWVWFMGMVGAIVKYSEIYLGLKYRQANDKGSYDGGPMYFLRAAFKKARWIPGLVAILLCVYGAEIYLFSVVTESVSTNWSINRYLVVFALLGLVFYCGLGGVKRIGKICGIITPLFVTLYVAMAFWVLLHHIDVLPQVMAMVFKAAFSGQAAVGGFVGGSVIMAIQQGVSRTAYSADIGIGFDSIIQSESSAPSPHKQARLAILGVLIDNLVCTVSILLVLVSGAWMAVPKIAASHLVQSVLADYFPLMHVFIPAFLTMAGFTVLIAYFGVGIKCSRYLHPKLGPAIYLLYAGFAFVFFTFFDQSKALLVMSLAGAMLLILNLLGIYRLRKEVAFVSEAELERAAV